MAITIRQQARLAAAVRSAEASYETAQLVAKRLNRAAPAVRHKCFIAYHGADVDAVTDFVETFNEVFIPRVVGVSESDYFKTPINSTDEDYIKDQIGSKYLSDSTVTILFVGRCTWSRKFVDWEIASTLRDGSVNKLNGLIGLTPANNEVHTLPPRFADNISSDGSRYAQFYYYPTKDYELRANIEDAFQARTSRRAVRDNTRKLITADSYC